MQHAFGEPCIMHGVGMHDMRDDMLVLCTALHTADLSAWHTMSSLCHAIYHATDPGASLRWRCPSVKDNNLEVCGTNI